MNKKSSWNNQETIRTSVTGVRANYYDYIMVV